MLNNKLGRYIYIVIILSLFSFSSCIKKVKIIDPSELYEKKGYVYLINEKNPFSGITIEKYKSGKIKKKTIFKNGKPDGLVTEYYEYPHKIKSKYLMKSYSVIGVKTIWYKNGFIKESKTIKNGLYDGKYCAFYENGHKKIKGFYINNKKNGVWKEWNINEILASEISYKNNKKHGKIIEYWISRKKTKRIKGYFFEDFEDGEWRFWKQDGTLSRIDYWGKGEFKKTVVARHN